MTITLYYHADNAALLDTYKTDDEQEAIRENYDDYVKYLEKNGFEINRDSDQTTKCWDGGDENEGWPNDVLDFWAWYN